MNFGMRAKPGYRYCPDCWLLFGAGLVVPRHSMQFGSGAVALCSGVGKRAMIAEPDAREWLWKARGDA